MSEISSISSQLLTTPMRDLLPLRLTGRLAWREAVRSAELPDDVKSLIERVVWRTRLWRLEQVDVAEELLSHFAEGLDGGATATGLIERFGDECVTARLIRRAKIRNRSMVWKVMRAVKWAFVALLLYYGILSVQFYTGRPTLKLDYLADVNRATDQTRVGQRAWPLYRRAMLEMGMADSKIASLDYQDDQGQQKMMEWVDAHSAAMELVRQAASKPVLGFFLGPNGSQADPQLYSNLSHPTELLALKADPELGSVGIGVRSPYLSQLRELATLLGADARSAVQHNDGTRYFEDVVATWQMSDQFTDCPDQSLLHYLVGLGIRAMAIDEVDRMLVKKPGLLTDSQLRQISRRLAVPQVGADLLNFDGERLIMDDLVQRVFTDDGHGNGHLTAEGMRMMREVSTETLPGEISVATMAFTSRRDFERDVSSIFNEPATEIRRPLRFAHSHKDGEQLEALERSPFFVLGYYPLINWLYQPDLAAEAAERVLGDRDGVLIGVALELYHRKHGRYPDSLEALVPSLLPAVPADRITGQPVKYRLIAGKPLVYSVGADRVDDGGKPAIGSFSWKPDPTAATVWFPDGATPRGDWILYPQSTFEKHE